MRPTSSVLPDKAIAPSPPPPHSHRVPGWQAAATPNHRGTKSANRAPEREVISATASFASHGTEYLVPTPKANEPLRSSPAISEPVDRCSPSVLGASRLSSRSNRVASRDKSVFTGSRLTGRWCHCRARLSHPSSRSSLISLPLSFAGSSSPGNTQRRLENTYCCLLRDPPPIYLGTPGFGLYWSFEFSLLTFRSRTGDTLAHSVFGPAVLIFRATSRSITGVARGRYRGVTLGEDLGQKNWT